MSRPLLKNNELRQRVDCYFNSEELAGIRSHANEAGLSLSTFIRKASLGVRIQIMPAANAEMWQNLAHATANLNQIAKHLNTGLAYGINQSDIDDIGEQVRLLRLQLVGAKS